MTREKDELQLPELEKYRILIQATLDYHLEHYTGYMVFDEWDPSAEHYLLQKQQTEKHFQERRADKLQQSLDNLIQGIRRYDDLQFEAYIKEETGYDIKGIENLLQQVIVPNTQIKKDKEELPVPEVIIKVNVQEASELKLRNMDEPFPDQPSECNFPDAIRRVIVQTNGKEERALTEVCISMKGGFGCIYCAGGENLPVKAYWKDKNTVIIETRKKYPIFVRHHQVRSREDLVKIEYLES